jgi:hypothetical protein
MDGGNEQRVVIKLCLKAGLSATETLVLVQKAYGIEAPIFVLSIPLCYFKV